jgi:O-antigen ligase
LEVIENSYLDYLVAMGALGLVAFLLVLLVYWGDLIFAFRRAKDPFIKYSSEAFAAGMVGIAVAAFFGQWIVYMSWMVSLFWFLIGMGAVIARMSRLPAEEDVRRTISVPVLPYLPM